MRNEQIVNLFPTNYPELTFVDVFGNGLVFFDKDPSRMEVYNDTEQEITHILRLCSDSALYRQLINLLSHGTVRPEVQESYMKYPDGPRWLAELDRDFPCNSVYHVAELVHKYTITDPSESWIEKLENFRICFQRSVVEYKDPLEIVKKYGSYPQHYLFCWPPSDYLQQGELKELLYQVKLADWCMITKNYWGWNEGSEETITHLPPDLWFIRKGSQ